MFIKLFIFINCFRVIKLIKLKLIQCRIKLKLTLYLWKQEFQPMLLLVAF